MTQIVGTTTKARPKANPLEDAWIWGASWDEFRQRFHDEAPSLVRAYKSAQQRGDTIGLKNVVARMKKLNDAHDARLSIEDPDAYEENLREEIQQKELREIFNKWEQVQLRDIANRVKAMGEDLRRSELRAIATQNQARTADLTIPSCELPARFRPLVKFAMRKFGLWPSEIPVIKLTVATDNALVGGVPRDAYGCYVRDLKEVRIRADLSDDQIEKTCLHELAHHYENLKGFLASEPFAYEQERVLYEQWDGGERHSAEWAT